MVSILPKNDENVTQYKEELTIPKYRLSNNKDSFSRTNLKQLFFLHKINSFTYTRYFLLQEIKKNKMHPGTVSQFKHNNTFQINNAVRSKKILYSE